MTKTMAWGAAIVGVAGLQWATYPPEILWCGSMGVGFLAFGAGIFLSARRGAILAMLGALVASIGGTHYTWTAIAAGHPWGAWSLVGIGIAIAALSSIASLFARRRIVWWGFSIAFGLVLAGLVEDAARNGIAFDVWGATSAAAIVGAAILALRAPSSFERAFARPPHPST